MTLPLVPFFVALAGALMLAFSTNGKVQRFGEILCLAGMIWVLAGLAGKTLALT